MASPAKDASAAGAGDMDGAPAAPATVEVASASTIDKLKEMAGVVTSYATKYRDAAPEGSLLTLIKEDLLSAAQEVWAAAVLRQSKYSDTPPCRLRSHHTACTPLAQLEGTKSAAEDDMDAQSLHVVVRSLRRPAQYSDAISARARTFRRKHPSTRLGPRPCAAQVQKKTASALVLVAGAVHKAAEYDEEHQVTSSLAKQLSSLYHAVIANLAKLVSD